MVERVLVTGATGKTGGALVRRLRQAGVSVRAASRSPEAAGDVAFDWHDPATFDAALDGIDGVYLVAPTDTAEPIEPMRPLLERAVALRRRLVLLSASSLPFGGAMMGAVHQWLAAHSSDFAVLRPTWFMQNFVTQHLTVILADGVLYSATGDGRIPFIDADDIAAVAASMLTRSDLRPGTAPILTGPQALSYDDVARMIARVSGRPVRHVRLSAADLARRYEGYGLPARYAKTLAGLDAAVAAGAEDRLTDEVERWTGRPPNDLQSYLESRRETFRPGEPSAIAAG